MQLSGKRALVTGGVRGLGRAVVEQLLERGAQVTVLDVDSAGLEALAADRPEVRVARCDVSDPQAVASAMEAYHAEHGAAHVLVNNAGILHSEPLVRLGVEGIERHAFESWQRVISADLTSVFLMTSYAVAAMVRTRTKGVVVNVSSVTAAGNAGQTAYAAAKAGVNALTATWAKELGAMGIRVVAVAPGYTGTDSTREALSESVLQEIVRKVPLRRLGKPEEIAAGVIAAIENDFFHGKVLEIDGGLVL